MKFEDFWLTLQTQTEPMPLPQDFLNQTDALLGPDAEALYQALNEPTPTSIRLHPDKPIEATFDQKVPWCTQGRYLSERPAFTFDPLLHAGCYYVQEAASMFVEKAVGQALALSGKQVVTALDLCAAPGGKSTLLASCLPAGSVLVANELIRSRANILAENLQKWGLPQVVVTQSDSSAFADLIGTFDLVLADVPCSGEGMFRKDPEAIGEWSLDNVRLCAERQRNIVSNIWPALKPGGFLLYSTCTFNTVENEENVAWICSELGGRLEPIPLEAAWAVSGGPADFADEPVHRFFPHRTKGEGFFLALIRKEGVAEDFSPSGGRTKPSSGKKMPKIEEVYQKLLLDSDRFEFYWDRLGRMAAFPAHQFAFLKRLEEKLKVIHAGVVLGELKGKDWLPDVSLALSVALNKAVVNTYELDKRQAIDFLRREALVLPDDCPRGWVLVCFEGHPLGWVKNLGNRANNQYPNEWRIRSENPF